MPFDWNSCHSMWKFKSFIWLFAGFAFVHTSVNKDANKYHVYPFPHPKRCIAMDLLKYLCKSLVKLHSVQFSSVTQLCLTLCNPMNHSTPASLSIANSQSPPKPMSIVSVMPSNHLILCCPLLLLPSISPSLRGFSNESALCIVAKVLEFQLQHQSLNEHPGPISFRMDCLDFLANCGSGIKISLTWKDGQQC